MAIEGFDDFMENLYRIRDAGPDMMRAAIEEETNRWYGSSQNTVPVGVDLYIKNEKGGRDLIHVAGTLKKSGQVLEIEWDGMTLVGGVSYGSDETLTLWHGYGYEIFVEFGTKKMMGRFFLTAVFMTAQNGALERMGESAWRVLEQKLAA